MCGPSSFFGHVVEGFGQGGGSADRMAFAGPSLAEAPADEVFRLTGQRRSSAGSSRSKAERRMKTGPATVTGKNFGAEG